MSNSSFQFKQFTIHHDLCAMKVGTDGVLLGAWTEVGENTKKILDIGTGSGLIAIMLAQKSNALITGIDIDNNAIEQARINSNNTPWSKRLSFHCENAETLQEEDTYSLIVCNPPFFQNSLHGPDSRRNDARHTSSLSFVSLIKTAYKSLCNNGFFNVILPFDSAYDFIQSAWERGLNLHKKCIVYTKYSTTPKRVLLSFKKGTTTYPSIETLYIKDENGEYTETFKELTKDYYLNF